MSRIAACFLITFAAKLKNMPFAKFAPALLINIDHSSRHYDQFLCLDNIVQGEGGGGGGGLPGVRISQNSEKTVSE